MSIKMIIINMYYTLTVCPSLSTLHLLSRLILTCKRKLKEVLRSITIYG